ncbi:MAG: universal stress protein [Acidimicrobiia bacterium]
MNRPVRCVVAALDNSDTASQVVHTAQHVATTLGLPVRALHIREDGDRTAHAVARAAGMDLETKDGNAADILATRAEEGDLVVLGSRNRLQPGEPFGHVARDVMTNSNAPIMLVPPDPLPSSTVTTLLVPLDGSADSESTLELVCEWFSHTLCPVVTLFVFEDRNLPPFGDHIQYETEAWIAEFAARHCTSKPDVHVELRVGNPIDRVITVAHEHHANYIVIGWKQSLEPGHALILRGLLERSRTPILLLPLR